MDMLVTGAGGQLGREWVSWLKNQNREFVSCTSGDLDITDPDVVQNRLDEIQPKVVINCAAFTDVDGSESDIETAMKVNRDGVRYLSRWCAGSGAVLVHFSTDYIFPGRRVDLVQYPEGYPEEAEPSPVNLYGKSKLAGEKEILASGTDYLLIRLSWLCGQYGGNFVKTMLRMGKEKKRVDVVKDQLGSPTFADTVTEKTTELLDRNERGVFHLTSGGLISWFDFSEEIFRLSDISVEVNSVMSQDFASKAARPSFSKLDTSKISRILESEMEDWRTGLNRLLQHLQNEI